MRLLTGDKVRDIDGPNPARIFGKLKTLLSVSGKSCLSFGMKWHPVRRRMHKKRSEMKTGIKRSVSYLPSFPLSFHLLAGAASVV